MNNNLEFDIVTPEMIDLQIKSLEALIRAKDVAIDSYLDMLTMMMKNPKSFNEDYLFRVREMIKAAQHSKKQYQQEIDIKKSVKSFL
jgi:hypothetical protein